MGLMNKRNALLGWTGVPVSDRPPTQLAVTDKARASVAEKLRAARVDEAKPFALIHPAAAFETKQWATANFARVAEELSARGFNVVAIAAPNENQVVANLLENSQASITAFTDPFFLDRWHCCPRSCPGNGSHIFTR